MEPIKDERIPDIDTIAEDIEIMKQGGEDRTKDQVELDLHEANEMKVW